MPLVLNGATSGSTTIQATDAVTATLTLPSSTGTLLSTANPQSGGVIQVVSTQVSSQVSTSLSSSLTFYDVSGLSLSITPKFSTSKILVLAQISTSDSTSGANRQYLQLVRGSTALSIGNASGSQFPASSGTFNSDGNGIFNVLIEYLDSPATTSPTTYKIQMASNAGSQTGYVNRTKINSQSDSALTSSQITLLEIAA